MAPEVEARIRRLGRLLEQCREQGSGAHAGWHRILLADVTAVRRQVAGGAQVSRALLPQWAATLDDAEAAVIGRALQLALGDARTAPSVEGGASRHPFQYGYHAGDDVYTPCGALMRPGPCHSAGAVFIVDDALEVFAEEAAAAIGMRSAGDAVRAMSSGLAAVRVPLLLLLARLRRAGQVFVVPRDSWLEVVDLLHHVGRDTCRFVEAGSAAELAAHAAAPDVGAVLYEPVTNTPAPRFIAPQDLWREVAVRRPSGGLAVVVDAAQTPLLDVAGQVPSGVEVFAAYSFTKWGAGGHHRRPGGLLVARTDPAMVQRLLQARSVQRAAPMCPQDAAWLAVDDGATLCSRLGRYRRNLDALANGLDALPGIEVRYQSHGAFVVLLDRQRKPGWARAAASAAVRAAAADGVPAGWQDSFGLPGPALSTLPGSGERALRLIAGSGPRSVTLRYPAAIRGTLTRVRR
ncbi:PLP-dependent transferase [Streptomyces sp. NPDC059002]|uniref:PLP-dependent transferase n=1 Tax=Streptomyces sp. NPDC059002 TaxID=3346690 RepID=UPI0036C2E503